MQQPQYSIVFLIHGDDSYIYHDKEGRRYKADERALQQARRVGEALQNAEVFIFHMKPKQRFLFFFPEEDGNSYYYRDGKLYAEQRYYWANSDSTFGFESEFYNYFSAGSRNTQKLLFYYGHEIPENPAVYHKSHRNRKFSIRHFATGLANLYEQNSHNLKPLDLLTLSTCYGGTPEVINALSPQAHFILTSPGNLHLSYIDSSELTSLLDGKSDFGQIAQTFAQKAFTRLSNRTETMVVLSLYDTEKLQPELYNLVSKYDKPPVNVRAKCADCETDAALKGHLPTEGVTVFYRPPKFGALKNKTGHSGWGCWQTVSESLSKKE